MSGKPVAPSWKAVILAAIVGLAACGGNAEVAFAETDKHAGINLAIAGSDVVADLVGYVVPHPGGCSDACPG